MEPKQLRELSDQELAVKERELSEAVFRFRLRRGMNQLDNPAAARAARREIARIKTIRMERARGRDGASDAR